MRRRSSIALTEMECTYEEVGGVLLAAGEPIR